MAAMKGTTNEFSGAIGSRGRSPSGRGYKVPGGAHADSMTPEEIKQAKKDQIRLRRGKQIKDPS